MECLCSWFCPRAELKTDGPRIVVDPFAGGCVRGIVASALGLLYIGVDISEMQVTENRKQASEFNFRYSPVWVVGDAEDVDVIVSCVLQGMGMSSDTKVDFICSCPPYYNLEKYGCGEKDLSMLSSYDEFLVKYRRIIKKCASILRPSHMACFVVGNVRGEGGGMHTLHSDTVSSFIENGCILYNDAVLLTSTVSAGMRATRTMSAASKLIPVHQNVCVFVKGTSFTKTDAQNVGIQPNSLATAEV